MNLLAAIILILISAVVLPVLVTGAVAWWRDWLEEREWRRG